MIDSACATRTGKIAKTEVDWRPPSREAQISITCEHDTEQAQLSEPNCEMPGSALGYTCRREPLFASDATADLDAQCDWGTGWPRLMKRLAVAAASKHEDRRLARRIEGRCARRNARLTHVFAHDLGNTRPLRYGVDGATLQFKPGGT